MLEGLKKIVNTQVHGHALGAALGDSLLHRLKSVFEKSKNLDLIHSVNKGTQILLMLKYQEMAKAGVALSQLEDAEFRSFSQNGEDGILLYLLSVLGMKTRNAVEICAGTGYECNSANLIINHGFSALLFEGDPDKVKQANAFYKNHPNTFIWPPKVVEAWITRDNINKLIKDNGYEGEVDLLTLDMDGVDYWMWKAIEVIEPRVVVVEYQDILGPELSVTVPYSENFSAIHTELGPDYCGASLRAFVNLAKTKGYRLVGIQRYGFNAFFVKDGEGEALLPEITIEECFKHPKVQNGLKVRYPKIQNMQWETV